MAKMKGRDVAIPHATSVISCIQNPNVGEIFEGK